MSSPEPLAASVGCGRPTSSPTRPARLAVGVVGAGRVGSVLGAALSAAGHRVVARTGGERGQALLPDAATLPAAGVLAAASVVLVAVPDDALAGVVAALAAARAWRRGQLVIHPSGTHGLAVLDPAAQAGALPLALHPVMTFTGTRVDLNRLAGASFGVTAPPPLRPVAEALALEMGGEPVWVPEEARIRYHAALSHAANHLMTVLGQAGDMLREAGVSDSSRVLAPLAGAALDNVLRSGDRALTGPVARGDAGTVARHLASLRGHPAEASYRVLARATADRALAVGLLDPALAGDLLAVLAEPADRL